MNRAIKTISSSFIALILAFTFAFSANTVNARPIPIHPHPHPHRHHITVVPFVHHTVSLTVPIVMNNIPPPPHPPLVRIWIPGTWIEERDIYGRIIARRWIPGHWEYR